jgi:uncharacterized protein (DUF952 family)
MIFHIVPEQEYLAQAEKGKYIPFNFNEFGFAHCALESSVVSVANDYYANVEGRLLLLKIDHKKLESQTKYEAAAPVKGGGSTHLNTSPVFPHVYGPINRTAIVGIGILRKGKDGYEWPNKFMSLPRVLTNIQ